jgi:hypothetical protein
MISDCYQDTGWDETASWIRWSPQHRLRGRPAVGLAGGAIWSAGVIWSAGAIWSGGAIWSAGARRQSAAASGRLACSFGPTQLDLRLVCVPVDTHALGVILSERRRTLERVRNAQIQRGPYLRNTAIEQLVVCRKSPGSVHLSRSARRRTAGYTVEG